jgi:hypothetical protein
MPSNPQLTHLKAEKTWHNKKRCTIKSTSK